MAVSRPSRGPSRRRGKGERRRERERSGGREEEEEEEVKPSKPTNSPSPPNNKSRQDNICSTPFRVVSEIKGIEGCPV
jgi:hypothetical protein